ncbi:MAG TPA: glucokinase [Candidatus Angelobacter sp.]
MILAGDIGGTHTRIALFEETAGKLTMALERVYPSREHQSLEEILSLFLSNDHSTINLVCFGVAGPVLHDQVSTPNLPWVVQALKLAQLIGVAQVSLINDLMAHASGVDDLAEADFVALNQLDRQAGNAALIAAGTGLGEAGIYWDGARRWPFPCEGGHCDFAPRNDLEIALLQYLLKKFGRVSYERVISGQGLQNVYDFLRDSGKAEEPAWLKHELESAPDPIAVISQYGVQGKASICETALDIFVSVYGAEAGNLALKMMAVGGLFVSGGIAAKILPKLTDGAFLQAFVTKGRLQPVLEAIPVKVIVNDRVGLIGAARYAAMHAAQNVHT